MPNSFPEDDTPASGRRVSEGATPARATEKDVVLSEFSVRAIGLYQKQTELTDRLWSYFGSISFFAVLLSLAVPVFAKMGWLPPRGFLSGTLYGLTALGYLAFSIGNRSSLHQSQDALERIAAQAQMASGIKLKVIRPRDAVFFHVVVSSLTLIAVVIGFTLALRQSV